MSPPRTASEIIAQCESFARKMPAFYAAIVACMIAQTVVFYGNAPMFLSVAAPQAIAAIALVRMIWWIRRRRLPFSEAEARSSLRKSKIILYASTIVIIGLDLITFEYVDSSARAFIMVELLGCTMVGVYCLMHIRTAAYVLAGAMLLSLTTTLDNFSREASFGMAIAVISLVAAMCVVMQSYHQDFMALIRTKDDNLRLANLDMLTNLPNRRQFFHDLDGYCAAAEIAGSRVVVAIADLDGFKPINDTHGHAIGDRLLQEIAARIGRDGTGFAHAYRLGGDEFALISTDFNESRDVLEPAASLIHSIGLSIGAGTGPLIGFQ